MRYISLFVLCCALLMAGPKPVAQAQDWMKYNNPYSSTDDDLGKPHRTREEIAVWSMRAVANLLSFEERKFNERIKENKSYFVKSGWEGYAGFLKESKVLGLARSDKYGITTISKGQAAILSDAQMEGVWHWQVSLPVMTSVTQKDPSGESRTVSSMFSRIEILIRRTDKDGTIDDDGMVISGWNGTFEG